MLAELQSSSDLIKDALTELDEVSTPQSSFIKPSVKYKSAYEPRSPSGRNFRSMKQLEVFLLSLDGMLVHHRATPGNKFTGTHLYTWMERGTVRVKSLA